MATFPTFDTWRSLGRGLEVGEGLTPPKRDRTEPTANQTGQGLGFYPLGCCFLNRAEQVASLDPRNGERERGKKAIKGAKYEKDNHFTIKTKQNGETYLF